MTYRAQSLLEVPTAMTAHWLSVKWNQTCTSLDFLEVSSIVSEDTSTPYSSTNHSLRDIGPGLRTILVTALAASLLVGSTFNYLLVRSLIGDGVGCKKPMDWMIAASEAGFVFVAVE